jgi:hypothetical protein
MVSIPLTWNVEWHAWRAGKKNQLTAHKSILGHLNVNVRSTLNSTRSVLLNANEVSLNARSTLNALQNGKYSAIAECRVSRHA